LIFLEINSVPRWEHFERITGIDVARAIVKMAQETVKRQAVRLTV
jgi:glutathione synthase/RimK-type ligase-like ATP-grasp enzyme